jgi:hypothetical protein
MTPSKTRPDRIAPSSWLGTGIPVAPFEKQTAPVKALRLLAPLSDDIDVVAKNFAQHPAASIGYSSCAAPFYLLLTNCLLTLRKTIVSDDRLQEARQLVERTGHQWPTGTIAPFQHAMFVFPRKAGDRIPMALVDGRPDGPSIMFSAGWLEGGRSSGAPNVVPIPMPLVGAVINDPQLSANLAGGFKIRPVSIH